MSTKRSKPLHAHSVRAEKTPPPSVPPAPSEDKRFHNWVDARARIEKRVRHGRDLERMLKCTQDTTPETELLLPFEPVLPWCGSASATVRGYLETLQKQRKEAQADGKASLAIYAKIGAKTGWVQLVRKRKAPKVNDEFEIIDKQPNATPRHVRCNAIKTVSVGVMYCLSVL